MIPVLFEEFKLNKTKWLNSSGRFHNPYTVFTIGEVCKTQQEIWGKLFAEPPTGVEYSDLMCVHVFGSAFELYSSTLYANYPDKHTLNVDFFPGCPYSTYRACSQCSTTLEHQIKLHKEWRNGLVSLSPSSSLSSTTSLAITSSSSMPSA